MPLHLLPAAVAALLGLIARHGHLRRVPGPVVVGAWQLARQAQDRVAAILARIAAGTLRRCFHRGPPTASEKPRRKPAPRKSFGWLVQEIPEAAQGAGLLCHALRQPGVAELLEQAPQLRRALAPLCRMLGVRPPAPPRPDPQTPRLRPPPAPWPPAPWPPAASDQHRPGAASPARAEPKAA